MAARLCRNAPAPGVRRRRTTPLFLLAAPTRHGLPRPLPRGSRVLYQALLAVFRALRNDARISSVALPSFGTGWGSVPPRIAVLQMWEAFYDAFAC